MEDFNIEGQLYRIYFLIFTILYQCINFAYLNFYSKLKKSYFNSDIFEYITHEKNQGHLEYQHQNN